MSSPIDAPAPAPAPRPPRRGLSALAAFMEERNIFWGELVGGLLVVGCSVALVVSLWSTFRENPLFRFATFTGAVAGVFGAGLYTLRRWKLESTSRGLLLLALLLTPAALLALCLPSIGPPGPLELPAQVAAVVALTALSWRAARVMTPAAPWLLAGTVGLLSACQIPAGRFIHPGVPETIFLALTLLAAGCFGLAGEGFLRLSVRGRPLDLVGALGVLLFLGVAGFALVLALGMIASLSGDAVWALARLGLPAALAGVPLLAGGALLHRGLEGDRRQAGVRTAGTAVALAGVVVLLLAVGLAWPSPWQVLAVCALDCAALAAVAFRFRLPALHALAIPCLVASCVVVCGLAAGVQNVPESEVSARMLAVALSPETGLALLVLCALCGLVSELLARLGALPHARSYAAGGVLVALLSLALVTPEGLQNPGRAGIVYALAGAGVLALNARWRRTEATGLGLALLVAATGWGLWRAFGAIVPAWGAVLAAEALALGVLSAWASRSSEGYRADFVQPAAWLAQLVGVLAVLLAGWSAWQSAAAGGSPWALAHVLTAACLSALWTVQALAEERPELARIASWLLLATLLTLAGWTAARLHLPEPLTLAAATGLAGIGLAGSGVFWSSRSSAPGWARLLGPAWAETAAGTVVLAVLLLLPGPEAPAACGVLLCTAATALLLARAYRTPLWSWAGSVLGFAALAHFLVRGIAPREIAHPILVALLAHATLLLLVSLVLRDRCRSAGVSPASIPGAGETPASIPGAGETPALRQEAGQTSTLRQGAGETPALRRLFLEPLSRSALLASFLAVPLIAVGMAGNLAALALWTLWLALLWLGVSWLERWPALFAAFQATLDLAALFAVSAWLRAHDRSLLQPASLYLDAFVLAGLGVVWKTVRLRAAPESVLGELLRPAWPAWDRVVLGTLVVLQFLGAALLAVPGAQAELLPVALPDVHGGWLLEAWALVGLLAVGLLVEARERVRTGVLLGLLVLALTVPLLAAWPFGAERATASALRWGWGICFVLCSLPLWLRDRLWPWMARLGFPFDERLSVAPAARRLLVAGTVVPVLAFTVAASLLRLYDLAGPGPAAESLFARMGRFYSTVGPLVMVCVGLVVHGLRERLPGYAFAVGLGSNLMASLLVRTHHRGSPIEEWWVPLVQANVIAFGTTALLWLAARRRLYAEHGRGALLVVQVILGLGAALLLLAGGAAPIVIHPDAVPTWTAAVGTAWGWLAIGLALLPAGWLTWVARREFLTAFAASAGLAAGALLACTASGWTGLPWLAYHVLLVCWAVVAAGLLVVGWLLSERTTSALGTWVPLVAVLVLGLALRGATADPAGPWWSAGTLAFLGVLAAVLAVWQRGEGWAFIGGLCFNAAVSLVLWHGHGFLALDQWWVPFAQANLLTAALVALVWLAGARHLYGGRPELGATPLLNVQVGLLLLGNAVLLLLPAGLLIAMPGTLPALVGDAGQAWGWAALLLALVAASWHTGHMLAPAGVHIVCGLALAMGVQLACTAVAWGGDGFLAYHVLMAAWAVVGGTILVAGWSGSRQVAPAIPPAILSVRAWVGVTAVLVVGLALRGAAEEPAGLWWPTGALIAAGVLAAGLAAWEQRERWAFAAALCLEGAVSLFVWQTHRGLALQGWWIELVQAIVLSAALAALSWMAVQRRLGPGVRPGPLATPLLSLQVILGLLGNAGLLAGPLVWLIGRPGELPDSVGLAGAIGGWAALAAALLPAAWYAGRALRRGLVFVLTGLGLAVAVLAACTVACANPTDWLAYHALLLGWALLALALTAGGWLRYRDRAQGEGLGTVFCVSLVGALVLALALRAVAEDPGRPWWSAGSLAFLGGLSVSLALWRRREHWMFLAGLILPASVALVLAHFRGEQSPADWWVLLVQALTITASVVALGWLALGRHLYDTRHLTPSTAPLLCVQVAALVAGNIALLIGPLFLLVQSPGVLPPQVGHAGWPAGWAALLLALAVASWYAGRMLAQAGVHVLCGLGLVLGVQLACTAANTDSGNWLAYHVLMASWAALGLLLLLAQGRRRVEVPRSLSRNFDSTAGASRPAVAGWVATVAALVLGLALRGAVDDPGAPWWPAGGILAASILAGGLALWRRREGWAFTAAAGVNLAVSLVLWHLHGRADLIGWWLSFLQANALAAALTAAAWRTAYPRLYGTSSPTPWQAPLLLAWVGLMLAADAAPLLEAVGRLLLDPGTPHLHLRQAGSPLGWLALLAGGGAALWHLHRYIRRTSVLGLTTSGLGAGALLACTAASRDQAGSWLAYHVLLLGWALAGLAVLLRGLVVLRRPIDATPDVHAAHERDVRRFNLCIGLVHLLLVGAVVRGAMPDPTGPWWCVGAVLAVCVQAAVLAVWQGSETWAFVATTGLDLAVSLVVWNDYRSVDVDSWWMQLLQANLLSGSVAALLWLAANRRAYAERPPGLASAPLLSVQAFLGLLGNAVLLLSPALAALVLHPGDVPDSVRAADGPAGWLTLGLTAIVALAQLRVTRMQGSVQVLCSLGLGAGVLAACTASWWDTGNWLAYHVLMASWSALAALMLAGGWLEARWRLRGDLNPQEPLLSPGLVREWGTLAGLPVLALALRGVLVDPGGAAWSAGTILGLSVLAALLGVWQRRERWIFTAGLGVNLALSLVLWRAHYYDALSEWWLPLVHANLIASACAALAWLAAAPRLYGPVRSRTAAVLTLQVLLVLAGNVLLLAWPAARLVLVPDPFDPFLPEVGGGAGWLALLLCAIGAVWHGRQMRGRNSVSLLVVLSLAAGVLTAATAARHAGGWLPYHLLMAAWALVGLSLPILGWASEQREGGHAGTPAALLTWTVLVGILVPGLALRGVGIDPVGPWWSAGGVLAVSGMLAVTAAWRRREVPAFAAALGVNLAVSLVVWRLHEFDELHGWWVRLVQLNILSSSAAALAWLALGRRLYGTVEVQKQAAPLRAMQCLLGLAGNALLLVPPAVLLVLRPDDVPAAVAHTGSPLGWLTLALALPPAVWQFGRRLAGEGVHVLCAAALGLGILTACTAAHAVEQPWLAYHVLLASWAVAGVVALTAGALQRLPQGTQPLGLQAWVVAFGALVLGLSLRSALVDTTGPWWPAGGLLAVSGLAAGMAAWQRREAWALTAGVGVNLAVSLLMWHAHRFEPPAFWWIPLLQANVAACAGVALAWLFARRALYPEGTSSAPLLTVQVLLGVIGNAVLLAGPALALVLHPSEVPFLAPQVGNVWGWLTLLAALLPAVWHVRHFRIGAGLHLVCSLALGLGILGACTAASHTGDPWMASHVLTASWALAALLALAADFLLDQSLAMRQWAIGMGVLVLVLACRAVAVDPGGTGWSAHAVLAMAGLLGGLAIRERREAWAFAACLVGNVAASFLLWGWHRTEPLEGWWLRLVQVNLIATSAGALVWLVVVRCLPAEEVATPLLGLQVLLGLEGNALLLAVAGAWLFLQPSPLVPFVTGAGSWWSWLALGMAMAGAFVHFGPLKSAGLVSVAGQMARMAGVLVACTVGAWWPHDWLAYHVLEIICAAAGPLMLAAGWRTRHPRASDADSETTLIDADVVRTWTAALAVLTLGLALRGVTADPGRPWWTVGSLLAVAVLAGARAVWEKREGWAFAAGLCINLAVSLLVWHAHQEQPMPEWWVRLVQGNVISSAAVALVWLAAARWVSEPKEEVSALGHFQPHLDRLRLRWVSRPKEEASLLALQVALGLSGIVLLLAGPAVQLVVWPGDLLPSVAQAGEWSGWVALLLAIAAASWHTGQTLARAGLHVLGGLGLALGVLAACTSANWDAHNWLAYHVLTISWTITGVAALAGSVALRPSEEETSKPAETLGGWAVAIGVLLVGLAGRGLFADPAGPWWSAMVFLITAITSGTHAVFARKQNFVAFSGLLGTAAGLACGLGWQVRQPAALAGLAITCLAVSGAIWSALESILRARVPPIRLRGQHVQPFAHAATVLPVMGVFVLVVAAIFHNVTGLAAPASGPLTWTALAATAIACVVSLWDVEADFSLAGLYTVALAGLGSWLSGLPADRLWTAIPALACFVTLAALISRDGPHQSWMQASLALPEREAGWPSAWFLPVQGTLGGIAVVGSVWLCLAGTPLQRFAGPLSLVLLLPAALLGVRGVEGARRGLAQQIVLFLGALALVETSWAWQVASVPAPWLQRSGLLLAACAVLTLAYGVVLPRLLPSESGWPRSARQAAAFIGPLALVLLLFVLGGEAVLKAQHVAPLMTGPTLGIVVAALVLLIVAGICFAVLPALDPLGLSERGRTGYVYAGELLLVALLLHLKLTAPWLFSGRLDPYWTFAVMGLAFAGAVVSEALARVGLRVLAEPLGITGIFLPVVPVVGFWLHPAGDYATLWFLFGLFYGVVAVVQRSLGFALLGALGGNVGLWVILNDNQKAFLKYPQLWLVPFSLTVLVAAQLNRDRLGRRALNSLRYAALTVIYLASTAETFLAGLGQDVVRPLALVGLALAGVFVGMVLRVRAFLFLGAGFVGLGVFALVWHAAESKSWLWYVAGIALGVFIIVLFAVFEKRRQEVLHLLERLRDWE